MDVKMDKRLLLAHFPRDWRWRLATLLLYYPARPV
jgi:hypothetical protein